MPIFLAQAATSPPAVVAPAPPRPSIITNPDWLMKPTGAELMALYPSEAQANKTEGRAVIRCGVSAQGLLMDCVVIQEDPPGAGFGGAVLKMSALFRMRPQTKDGVPVSGGVVNIPIRFTLPPPEVPPPAPAQAAPGPAIFELTTTGSKAFKWLEKPNAQMMAIAMVKYSGVREGRVVLLCQVAASGRLEACRVDSESPAKMGLRNAALALTPVFKIAPTTADGGSVAGGTLAIPLHFFSP